MGTKTSRLDLARIGARLAERAEAIKSLPPDRLEDAYQEGERLLQDLRLTRAMINAQLERLNGHRALLRTIASQSAQPARPRIVSAF